MGDKSERVMIFIDGSNLYHSLKGFFRRTDIDIGKLCNKLLDKRRLVRIYYYNAKVGLKEEPERYRDQQAFFASVNAIPYSELRLGRLVYNNWPDYYIRHVSPILWWYPPWFIWRNILYPGHPQSRGRSRHFAWNSVLYLWPFKPKKRAAESKLIRPGVF